MGPGGTTELNAFCSLSLGPTDDRLVIVLASFSLLLTSDQRAKVPLHPEAEMQFLSNLNTSCFDGEEGTAQAA